MRPEEAQQYQTLPLLVHKTEVTEPAIQKKEGQERRDGTFCEKASCADGMELRQVIQEEQEGMPSEMRLAQRMEVGPKLGLRSSQSSSKSRL